MTKQKGFTLIELLVVIAIIGILSSVVLASMNTARKKSRDARRQQDLKSMQVALELMFDANNTYPVQATAVLIGGGAATASGTTAVITSAYMTTVPQDPQWDSDGTPAATARGYWYAGSASTYCLGAVLEGTPGSIDGCGTTASTPGAAVTGSSAALSAITGYNASTAVGTGNVLKVAP